MNELNIMGYNQENNLLSDNQTKTIQKCVRGWLKRKEIKYHDTNKRQYFKIC